MYDELIQRLRDIARSDGNIKSNYIGLSLLQAADAIEELQKVANELLEKYQEEATSVICEYSSHIEKSLDSLDKKISTYQAQIDGRSEPPKEE